MKRIRHFFTHNKHHKGVFMIIAAFIIVDVFLGGLFLYVTRVPYPEVLDLEGNTMTFKQLSNYFVNLANDKGAVYSFDVLKRADIPANTDIHLLAHGVGDVLYEQQGIKGILACTDDFRNACSHQIVINALVQEGPTAFPSIADTCRLAPGGKNAYSMCYHGLGHGVLAYNGYDLGKAMDMCNLSGPKAGNEAVECMGGAVMEMMAGVHNVNVWKKQSLKYFDETDPLAPCDRKVVLKEAKHICYIYLTPHLFKAAGVEPGKTPTDKQITKATSFCAPLSGSDRSACYGGFGKEFAPMANNKDIRTIGSITDSGLRKILHWCSAIGVKDGINVCIVEAMRSLYWAGTVDPGIAARFCTLADAIGYGKSCIQTFVGAVGYYVSDRDYRSDVCASLPATYNEMCRLKLL